MVKVRGRNSNGKTVKQTAEKLARASICDVVVPHWCHLAIMQGHATDSQSQSAGAWHQWLMPAARRRHPRFLAIFGRLFDRLPVWISTSDLHHRILRKKIYHIRAYDFGVQFSFNIFFISLAKHDSPLPCHSKLNKICTMAWVLKHESQCGFIFLYVFNGSKSCPASFFRKSSGSQVASLYPIHFREEAKCLWTPYTYLFFRGLTSYCWYNPQPMRNDHSIAGTTILQTTLKDADDTQFYWW